MYTVAYLSCGKETSNENELHWGVYLDRVADCTHAHSSHDSFRLFLYWFVGLDSNHTSANNMHGGGARLSCAC